ncbi:MAG TPA: hypothetical protein EYQ23_06765 [Verrucomicrobiales bacterium]|nr:hypothetical protein [Verrucomicrobiales bacterium]
MFTPPKCPRYSRTRTPQSGEHGITIEMANACPEQPAQSPSAKRVGSLRDSKQRKPVIKMALAVCLRRDLRG